MGALLDDDDDDDEGMDREYSRSTTSLYIYMHVAYTVSGKKINPCIHCHNSGKQCRILTEFWNKNAMSNCKQITRFQ